MNSIQIALAITFGICLYVGLNHALIGLRRRPIDITNLIFALMSFAIALQSISQTLLHIVVKTGSEPTFVAVDRWTLLGTLLGTLLLLWFIAFYTEVKPYPVLIALSIPLLVLLGVHIMSDYTYLYTDVTGFFDVPLPWGEIITVGGVELSRWGEFFQLMLLVYAGFAAYAGVRQYRRGERREALIMGFAVAIFMATHLNDYLLDLGLITSVYASQFGYVALIVVMSLVLSNEIIDTERQLETLNVELEERVEDRTARLSQANQDLLEAKEAAESANRAKTLFLANMSHELRTPLNAILGFAQLMERDPSMPARQLVNLGIIRRSGNHLLDLINDVLEMAKIEVGQNKLVESSFDLYAMLDSLQEMVKLSVEDKGLRFGFERGPDVPQYVKTDERRLRQVLINLLSNAIKFTDEGSVMLHTSVVSAPLDADGGKTRLLRFEVIDTGVGIEPAELDRLFEPFVQTASGLKTQRGTGLGLPICGQFVELMGGQITVRSKRSPLLGVSPSHDGGESHGTTVVVEIPVAAATAVHEQSTQSSHRVLRLESGQPEYRVLVVDDNLDNRLLLSQLLMQAGFLVREAEDGQKAIEANRDWHPHLIWMDMRMPEVDGYEATRQIKAADDQAAPVIIAVTASAFEEDRAAVMSAGCDDFVRKPFDFEEIFDKIAHFLPVKYIYDADVAMDVSIDIDTAKIDLSHMPAEWVNELQQAAMRGHAAPVLELIGQLPPDESPTAQQLSNLVHDFQFSTIVAVTETYS